MVHHAVDVMDCMTRGQHPSTKPVMLHLSAANASLMGSLQGDRQSVAANVCVVCAVSLQALLVASVAPPEHEWVQPDCHRRLQQLVNQVPSVESKFAGCALRRTRALCA